MVVYRNTFCKMFPFFHPCCKCLYGIEFVYLLFHYSLLLFLSNSIQSNDKPHGFRKKWKSGSEKVKVATTTIKNSRCARFTSDVEAWKQLVSFWKRAPTWGCIHPAAIVSVVYPCAYFISIFRRATSILARSFKNVHAHRSPPATMFRTRRRKKRRKRNKNERRGNDPWILP